MKKNIIIIIFILFLTTSVKAYDTYTVFTESVVDTFIVSFSYATYTEFTESTIDTFVITTLPDTSVIEITPTINNMSFYIKQRKKRLK